MSENGRGAAGRRPLAHALPPFLPFLLLASGALVAACSDSPAEPAWNGSPGDPVRQLHTFTEWVKSEPELKQQTEFFYDTDDRLIRFEFGRLGEDGSRRSSVRAFYGYEGERLVDLAMEVRPPGVTEWSRTREVAFEHDGSGRIVRADLDWIDERTGEITHASWSYEYGPGGRLARVTKSEDNVEELTWDDQGNVVRRDLLGDNHLVHRWEHDETVNPFQSLPVISGVNILGVPDRGSAHNSVSAETGVAGAEEPASRAEGVITADEAGYPTRKEWTVWNTATPDVRLEIVTIYEYR